MLAVSGTAHYGVVASSLVAVVIAVVLWSGTSLFVRAGHSDALVFTTWRLWFALPPLAAIVAWRAHRTDSAPFWPEDVPRGRWLLLHDQNTLR